jgi:hypothetical protein
LKVWVVVEMTDEVTVAPILLPMIISGVFEATYIPEVAPKEPLLLYWS